MIINLLSCDRRLFKQVNNENEDLKLYFFYTPFNFNLPNEECDFMKNHRNFYIDDSEIIKEFQFDMIKEKNSVS
jgi:hypothetical protein